MAYPSPTRSTSGGGVKGVQVIVRVRPMQPAELQHDNAVEVLSAQELVVYKPDAEFASAYDQVHGVQSTQQELYQQVQGGVLSSLEGYNCTVFAYGQTGTGKTHSMMGPPNVDVAAATTDAAAGSDTAAGSAWYSMGVIPRALVDLFNQVKARQAEKDGSRIGVAASYLEIYNDRLYDLLQPYKKGMSGRDPLDMLQHKALHEVREDKAGATYVPNALVVPVNSLSAVLALIAKGTKHRAVRHTEMNMTSSRSHAILQLVIEQFTPGTATTKSSMLRSKLNFVDLAGSERWNKGIDMGSERVDELTSINGSLSALATVVAALSEGASRRHVPYRDSKLTHLLQDSLGGNCRTTIIATISPSVLAFDESVSTLKFADRASSINNNPIVNTSRDLNSVLALKEREIHRLRQLLASYMDPAKQQQQEAGGDASAREPQTPSTPSAAQAGGEASNGRGGSLSAEELMAELENTRRALDMERQLRAELEAQLRQAATQEGAAQLQAGMSSGAPLTPSSALPSAGGAGASSDVPYTPGLGGAPPSRSHLPPGVDYLRISTPRTDADSTCTSPSRTVGEPSPSGGGASSLMPFKAVMNRRAELGLSPAHSGTVRRTRGSSAASSPTALHSPAYRLNSAAPNSVGRSWGAGLHRSPSPLTSHGHRHHHDYTTRSKAQQASMLDASVNNIQEQLLRLEQQNRERMEALMSSNKAARAAVQPQPRRSTANSTSSGLRAQEHMQVLQAKATGPESVYGIVDRRYGNPRGGAYQQQPKKPTSQPAYQSSAGPGDSFDRLLASAHACVQESTQQVPTAQFLPLAGLVTAQGSVGEWGRRSIMQGAAQHQMPSSAPGQGGGWGRSSLLQSSQSNQAAEPQIPLSAPSASWGRSAFLQQAPGGQSMQSGAGGMNYQHPYPSMAQSQPSKRNTSARSPGRLDKGSLIYILGSSTSSVRAKAMANALQNTAWG